MHHQLLFHRAKNHAPDYGSPDGSNPTDYRHQQDGDAGLEGKYVSGIKERGAPRVDASGNARQTSSNGVDPKLGGIRIHAQIGGGIFILFDRAQRQSELAVDNDRGNQDRQRHSGDRGIIMLIRAERLVLSNAIAAGAARDVKIVHDHAHGFRHADGGNHKIWSPKAERRQADQERRQYGNGGSTGEAEVWAVPGVHEQRRSVSTQAKEDSKSERNLAGHPANQVPGQARGSPYSGDKQQPDKIAAGMGLREQKQDQQQQPRQTNSKPAPYPRRSLHAAFHLRLNKLDS